MTSTYKQLKTAADQLDKIADAVEASEKAAAAKLAAATTQAKTAAAAAAPKVDTIKLAQAAKHAASLVKKAGLLSDDKQADAFAAGLLNSHEGALAQLAKLAGFVTAPKIATVVADDDKPAVSTADANWDAAARRTLSQMG